MVWCVVKELLVLCVERSQAGRHCRLTDVYGEVASGVRAREVNIARAALCATKSVTRGCSPEGAVDRVTECNPAGSRLS